MSNVPFLAGRRQFLRGSAAAFTALSCRRAAAQASAAGPSDTLRVAVSGCGQQAVYALIPSLRRIPGIQIAAICDIRSYSLQGIRRQLQTGDGPGVQAFSGYDEMLDKAGRDLDAVIIATPCWMHAEQTIKALEAGKHVYCEKTMAHTVEAARAMVRAQRKTGRLLQIGHQRRSNPNYLHLRDRILGERKLTGRITHLYGQWHRGVRMPMMPRISDREMEPIKAAGYASLKEYANWRWFKKYGGGPISDLGGHQIDVFNMLLGAVPRAILATGGTDFYRDLEHEGQKLGYEHLDNAHVTYEYDVPGHGLVRAHYQMLTTCGYQGYHEKVLGTEAAVLISENMLQSGAEIRADTASLPAETLQTVWAKALDEGVLRLDARQSRDENKPARDTFLFPALPKDLDEKPPHQHHLENFFSVVRRGGRQSDLHCPAEEAFKTCVAVMAVNDAVREQRRLELTPEMYAVD